MVEPISLPDYWFSCPTLSPLWPSWFAPYLFSLCLQSCASALLIVPLPWPVTVPLHDIPICRRAFLQFTIHLIERCFRWFHPNQSLSKYTIHIHALLMTENSIHTLRPSDALQIGATLTQRDREETNCWINDVIFYFLSQTKSILIASWNSDWTTNGRWTILMIFLCFSFFCYQHSFFFTHNITT